MARKGIFRRISERISTSVEKVAEAVTTSVKKTTDTIAAPFKKKEQAPRKSRKTAKKPTTPKRVVPPPKPAPPLVKPKPSPAVAREQLMAKFQDMFWLQKKWDAAKTSKRIDAMTDEQVYAALDMTENEIESAVRADPRTNPKFAAPDDPNSNILWYHGGEVTTV